MDSFFQSALRKSKNITDASLTIYDLIAVGDNKLWLTSPELTSLLSHALIGKSLHGMPIRTRSKVAKTWVCEALGYPTPSSFKKCQPRFTGQAFDTYVQKS